MLGRSSPISNPVKLSVCIDMILTEIPFLQRMETVKRLGYPAFEFWEWKKKDIEAILRKKNELGLEIATMMGTGWKQMNSEDARKTFVRCPKCGTPFELSRDPQTGKRRDARFCSARCRVAHYRARIERAQQLGAEGLTPGQIAHALGTQARTVNRWLKGSGSDRTRQ